MGRDGGRLLGVLVLELFFELDRRRRLNRPGIAAVPWLSLPAVAAAAAA